MLAALVCFFLCEVVSSGCMVFLSDVVVKVYFTKMHISS